MHFAAFLKIHLMEVWFNPSLNYNKLVFSAPNGSEMFNFSYVCKQLSTWRARGKQMSLDFALQATRKIFMVKIINVFLHPPHNI